MDGMTIIPLNGITVPKEGIPFMDAPNKRVE